MIFGAPPGDARETKRILCVKYTMPEDRFDFRKTEAMGLAGTPSLLRSRQAKSNRERRGEDNRKFMSESCKPMVSYPWKRDPTFLPDSKSQAIEKLEATERRLMKNPKNTQAYDRQMVETSEMEFSRKLSEKDLKEHKGPVRYISHHAVLRPESKSTPLHIASNSSAVF